MMNGTEYMESIKQQTLNLYLLGEYISTAVGNPILQPSLNSVKMTYDLALDKDYAHLMTAVSHISGKTINRFTHIHQNTEDLINKVKMQRLCGQCTASCFQRCVGMDALNAVYSTTYDIDQFYCANYHDRFLNFLSLVQEKDLTVDGAMTDPKGDRSLSPSAQSDPDLYLHITERRDDGIVVCGAKAHQTGICNSHEILVMPTISMKKGEEEYAVCFAIPVTTRGITIIAGRQSCDTRKLEQVPMDTGNCNFGGMEALVIFDHVFVPTERIFMNGETEFTQSLVERFAGFHRQSYGGCKCGVGDVLIGASALAADYNGVSKASHVKDKLIEMNHLNETMYSCGIACSALGTSTAAGSYTIDLLLANVCKLNVTRFPYEITRLAEDIAGGLMVTAPSEKDLNHPDLKAYIEKYLQGASGTEAPSRLRLLRLIENITLGTAAVGYRTESMHGAGSPQAQRIMIGRMSGLEEKKKLAKKLAGISDNLPRQE